MRHGVVRFGDADVRIDPLAGVAAHHEREDARDVGLVGQRQQIEQQHHVLFERFGNADRRVGHAQFGRGLLLGPLDPLLDLPDVLEVIAEPVRSRAPSPPSRSATSSLTESRMLRSRCIRARR